MKILFFLTITLLFGLGLVFAQTDRQDVMAHWNERRCDPTVVIAANLYKPADDSRSGTTFAAENLSFCVNNLIQQVFTVALNPFLATISKQMDFTNVLQTMILKIKDQIATFFKSFTRIFGGVYQRFIMLAFNFRRIFVEFLTAMKRAFAIAIGAVFSGMSMIIGIQNFYDFVIKVVLIILGILAGLILLLFLAFFPVIPIILTTIGVLVAGGVGAAAGFSGVFCFAPSVEITTMRGIVAMNDLKLGDRLSDGGLVEGILKVNGTGTDIYKLGQVRVSGDHMVYYEALKKWILVKEHPDAQKELKQEPILICLNTSTRTIPLQGFTFRDWEEIPLNRPDLQSEWNQLVAKLLESSESTEAGEYPLFNGAWFVQSQTGKVALRDVDIGLKILDHDGSWTKVMGIYEGTEACNEGQGPFWHTDSIWWKTVTKTRESWAQKSTPVGTKKTPFQQRGFHLVTGSGTFRILNDNSVYSVRDFTEVGQAKIAETYEWMKARL